jgi:hypothetical protein
MAIHQQGTSMTEDGSDEDTIKAYELDPDEITFPKEEIMNEFDSINQELAEINETLESNERHIHIFPPDSDIVSPIVGFEILLSTFALMLPLIQLVQGNQVNELSVALGAALFVHVIYTKT